MPLVISGPDVQARGALDDRSLVSGLDLLPTLCDYAAIPPPEGVRGISLRPVIEKRSAGREFMVSELSVYGGKQRQGRMLRSSRYKYIVFSGGARPEQLFDLQLDPGEMRDLAPAPQAAEIMARHRRQMSQWIRETSDDFPIPAS